MYMCIVHLYNMRVNSATKTGEIEVEVLEVHIYIVFLSDGKKLSFDMCSFYHEVSCRCCEKLIENTLSICRGNKMENQYNGPSAKMLTLI